MLFSIYFLAAMANMMSHLGDLVFHSTIAYEVNRAVDHGVLEFLGLVLAPSIVSTVRCGCHSFQPSSCWPRKCHQIQINDDVPCIAVLYLVVIYHGTR